MDCDCKKKKHSYNIDISEVVDGEIKQVMYFNFCGHHDMAMIAQKVAQKGNLCDLHAKELTVGLRLLHRALKENADKPLFEKLLMQLDEFKQELKKCVSQSGSCESYW